MVSSKNSKSQISGIVVSSVDNDSVNDRIKDATGPAQR